MLRFSRGLKKHATRRPAGTIAALAAMAALWSCSSQEQDASVPPAASAPTAPAQIAADGEVLGALAKANLVKSRPTAPVDFTGTYNFKVEGTDANGHEFLPHPQLTPKAQAFLDKKTAYRARGFEYLENAGTCWPYGVPQIMTRYWPVQFVQLPTMVLVLSMVTSNVRRIYIDGRGHPADEDLVLTYNGHSIGHWEGKTLVVDTIGFTDVRHYVSDGVPGGEKLHVVERISLSEDTNTLQIEFTMTDPDNWIGEWKNTKRYTREEYLDIQEHICIYEEEAKLPAFKNNLSE